MAFKNSICCTASKVKRSKIEETERTQTYNCRRIPWIGRKSDLFPSQNEESIAISDAKSPMDLMVSFIKIDEPIKAKISRPDTGISYQICRNRVSHDMGQTWIKCNRFVRRIDSGPFSGYRRVPTVIVAREGSRKFPNSDDR